MDYLVSLNNLLHNSLSFLFIHLPYFADSVVVALLKSLVFLLKFFEHLSKVFELLSALDVLLLEFSKFFLILPLNFSHDVLESSLS